MTSDCCKGIIGASDGWIRFEACARAIATWVLGRLRAGSTVNVTHTHTYIYIHNIMSYKYVLVTSMYV